MTTLSSLPLKKRPLRYELTCNEAMADVNRDIGLLLATTTSCKMNLGNDEMNARAGHSDQLSSASAHLYCRFGDYPSCHSQHFDRVNSMMAAQHTGYFLSPNHKSTSRGAIASPCPRDEVTSSISSTTMDLSSSSSASSSQSPVSSIHCSPCNKHFIGKAKYRAHVRRHNSKLIGRYQCPDCSKRFVQRSSLVTHLRIHTGERPYKCDYRLCSESFSDYSTYTKHVRTHTGEKPYTCPICRRAFSQSGNMHRHLKGVHKHVTSSDLLQIKLVSKSKCT